MFLSEFQQSEIQRFFRWKPKLAGNVPLWAWSVRQWVHHLPHRSDLLRSLETESVVWVNFSLDLAHGWMQFLWHMSHQDGSLWVDEGKCMEWPTHQLKLSLSVHGTNAWWQDADGNRRSADLDQHLLSMTREYHYKTLPEFERKIETVLRGMNDAMKYQIMHDAKRRAKMKRSKWSR